MNRKLDRGRLARQANNSAAELFCKVIVRASPSLRAGRRDPIETMKALDLFKNLFQHMEWADATVWRAVLNSPAASADERIKNYLHHIHMVQHAFVNVWREEPHSANAGSELALTELPEWGGQFHELAVNYLQTLSEEDLDKPMVMPWAKYLTKHLGRDPDVTTKGETILQVAAHSTYHRGQVNARLRELGAEPPLVDYIAWIWFGKPAADWGDARGGHRVPPLQN